MRKPVVGETLYSLNAGWAVKRHIQQVLTTVQVKKVGRKYFWCGENDEEWKWYKYRIKDWLQCDELTTSALYETEQAWEDHKEETKLCLEIHKAFEYGKNHKKIPLMDLREFVSKMPLNNQEAKK